MLEVESGLGQNMKVVGNEILEMPTKFQLNLMTVSCEMTKIPLTTKWPNSLAVLRFHGFGFIFHYDPYQICQNTKF